jgi:hypothetical protein
LNSDNEALSIDEDLDRALDAVRIAAVEAHPYRLTVTLLDRELVNVERPPNHGESRHKAVPGHEVLRDPRQAHPDRGEDQTRLGGQEGLADLSIRLAEREVELPTPGAQLQGLASGEDDGELRVGEALHLPVPELIDQVLQLIRELGLRQRHRAELDDGGIDIPIARASFD